MQSNQIPSWSTSANASFSSIFQATKDYILYIFSDIQNYKFYLLQLTKYLHNNNPLSMGSDIIKYINIRMLPQQYFALMLRNMFLVWPDVAMQTNIIIRRRKRRRHLKGLHCINMFIYLLIVLSLPQKCQNKNKKVIIHIKNIKIK